MAMSKFIHIQSSKFPILPNEEVELVNDGMYGKALALYLQEKLNERGYDSPFVCCEDWGWWVELQSAPFAFGVCIHAWLDANNRLQDFACCDSVSKDRQWSWKRLWFVDTREWSNRLYADLMDIFQVDPEIQIVAESTDFPL